MPDTIKLLELSYVLDCDTDMYRIGEIDGGLHESELDSFLSHFKEKGYNELLDGLKRIERQLKERYMFISTTHRYHCNFEGNLDEIFINASSPLEAAQQFVFFHGYGDAIVRYQSDVFAMFYTLDMQLDKEPIYPPFPDYMDDEAKDRLEKGGYSSEIYDNLFEAALSKHLTNTYDFILKKHGVILRENSFIQVNKNFTLLHNIDETNQFTMPELIALENDLVNFPMNLFKIFDEKYWKGIVIHSKRENN